VLPKWVERCSTLRGRPASALRLLRAKRRAVHKKEAWRLAAGGAEEEFVDEEAGEARRIVADEAVFFEEIVEHKLDLEFEEFIGVNDDGLGTFGAITAATSRRRLAIGDNQSMTRLPTWS